MCSVGKNWIDANKYCKATRRGYLATVLDENDNYEVASECSKLGTRWHCWLGLKRPFETWITGEHVTYVNWLPGEPNNWGGDENCVEIYGTDEQIGNIIIPHSISDIKTCYDTAEICQKFVCNIFDKYLLIFDVKVLKKCGMI